MAYIKHTLNRVNRIFRLEIGSQYFCLAAILKGLVGDHYYKIPYTVGEVADSILKSIGNLPKDGLKAFSR